MITSTSNPKVKQTAALVKKARFRKETGLFVVEGPKMFEELPPDRLEEVYVTEAFYQNSSHKKILARAGRMEIVSKEVMRAMSDTQTPQGVLAVARQYRYTMADLVREDRPALIMILETVQDPGNLGTILRAGEGAGITGILMDENTADIYNPKVIRSTMGSIYRVPFVTAAQLPQALSSLKKQGIRLFAAHLDGKQDYDQADYKGNTGFLIGNESRGLSEETAALADTLIKIPMEGNVESLNAAVAASVLMFESSRQRRNS